MNQILQRMKAVGGTFNGKKLEVCVPAVLVVGHRCTINGREADPAKVHAIRTWLPCTSLTEVRSFLGTCSLVRIFVKNFSQRARPLVRLTQKDVAFDWTELEQAAMDDLKHAVISSTALRAIDYECGRDVILAVDSSIITTGFILLQLGEDRKRYPSCFGSIGWNERESRYSQAKIELYGLFRALRAFRIYIVDV